MVTAPVAPSAVQETLDTGALEAEFDPLFDGDVDIEEGPMDILTVKRPRRTEISRLLSVMIRITTFCLGDE